MVENKHGIAKNQWKKWDEDSRDLFNKVFQYLNNNQELFLHPKTRPVPEKEWKTTAWNAAWIAADTLKEMKL